MIISDISFIVQALVVGLDTVGVSLQFMGCMVDDILINPLPFICVMPEIEQCDTGSAATSLPSHPVRRDMVITGPVWSTGLPSISAL